jgi:hypothetical protein
LFGQQWPQLTGAYDLTKQKLADDTQVSAFGAEDRTDSFNDLFDLRAT